jgi:hypothetical protein
MTEPAWTKHDLGWWLGNFTSTAFRLETLDRYRSDDEDAWFEGWRRTGSVPMFTPENDPWCKHIAKARAEGKLIQRVHLVSPPLPDYVRFEFACQEASVAAGEDCRVAHRHQHADLHAFKSDFWLFDGQAVILLRYDDDGRFLEAVPAEGDVASYRRVRDLALSYSISLKEYLATL